ncbi:hypothetical protein So717_38480 [Roseobacter cerasinus]|uniref:Tyr recombinase domain-containing protein n=1 Tax=Roseobacter cerasinus TaxID=2602289 RepID=A0A640VYR2_9RHOB|nr:tyrosine-type recombinase/integrase [Roseobacter cerasinus]GFE52095.1 hypothetical protein So717_38480 [Roseobacter cerasinus]
MDFSVKAISLVSSDDLAAALGFASPNDAFRGFCRNLGITPVRRNPNFFDPKLVRLRLDQRVMTLACETGLRPADLVRLTRGNLESFDGIDRFRVRTQKRGRVAHIPVTPELRQLIDETPADQLVLLVNDRGKPLRPTSASRAITRYRDRIADKLSDPTLRLQDTRGTAATRLLRAGLGLNQIANHMGWSLRYAAAVIEHYAAVSPAESAEVLDLLEREKQRREGKTVNAIVNAPNGAKRGES